MGAIGLDFRLQTFFGISMKSTSFTYGSGNILELVHYPTGDMMLLIMRFWRKMLPRVKDSRPS